MSEITAVTFDLWQTLLLDNRELGRARAQVRLEGTQQALTQSSEEYDLEHIREAYRACFRQCRQIRETGLDLTFRKQVELFINLISPDLISRLPDPVILDIMRAYSDSFFVHPPIPHTDMHSVLKGARDMGLKIGLISNTGMTPGVAFRRFLEENGVLHLFDILTFSDEVKLSKPAPEIFTMTLRSLDATPDQTVHVGDHVENDVVGAKQCGLKTIWIEGFYEREDPSDPRTQPNIAVSGLGSVMPALRTLAA